MAGIKTYDIGRLHFFVCAAAIMVVRVVSVMSVLSVLKIATMRVVNVVVKGGNHMLV